jgi:hypothetical protein
MCSLLFYVYFRNLLQQGSSKPWPDVMKELTGQSKMDVLAILEYFKPLHDWLKEQNKGENKGTEYRPFLSSFQITLALMFYLLKIYLITVKELIKAYFSPRPAPRLWNKLMLCSRHCVYSLFFLQDGKPTVTDLILGSCFRHGYRTTTAKQRRLLITECKLCLITSQT